MVIKLARRLIGYGITDVSGQCTINYIGKGLGNINLIAESGGEVYFEDKGTSSEHNAWTYITGATISWADGDCAELVQTDSTVFCYQYWSPTDLSTDNMCFEFDIKCTFTAGNSNVVRVMNGSTARRNFTFTGLGLVSGQWQHIKIVIKDDKVSAYVDDVEKLAPTTIDTWNRFQMQITSNSGSKLKYKNFVVYRDESSIVSSPFRVLDCFAYDTGISGNSGNHPNRWYNYANRITVSAQSDGTLLTGQPSSAGYYVVNMNEQTIPNTSNVSLLNEFDEFIMEFELVASTNNLGVYLRGITGTYTKTYSTSYLTSNNVSHIRCVARDGVFMIYLNGHLEDTITRTYDELVRVGIQTGNGATVKFKNFQIYPI